MIDLTKGIAGVSWNDIGIFLKYCVGPILLWLFSNAIQSMPIPSPNDSKKYIWLYEFLHMIGANRIQVAWAQNSMQSKVLNEKDNKSTS